MPLNAPSLPHTRAPSDRVGRAKVHAMTVDVEDYFQVSAFESHIDRRDWETLPCRTPENVDRILAMLDDAGVRATFFTLGWMALRYPGMVRRIAEQGHEVASHGYGHQRVGDLSPEAFGQDIGRARKLLEDVTGLQVWGYRAPSFSIGEHNPWAFDVLLQEGYRYSSSVYPIQHDHYGMPDAPRFAFRPREGLLEIPATTLRWRERNWPCSGGGYFRLMPYALSRWMIRQVQEQEGASAVFYFHPWEIDPEQPRVQGLSAKTRFRHYVNLGANAGKLQRLLRDFHWARMDEIFLGRQQARLPAVAVPEPLVAQTETAAWNF